MKLQLALDVLGTEAAVALVKQTEAYIDIIEIGTPLIKHEGLEIVKRMKQEFPSKTLLVDLKSMDVGAYEADFCFEAGADMVTVLGVADIDTIKGSINSAKKHGKKAMVDLLNVENKVEKVKSLIDEEGVLFGVHTGIDQQNRGETPLQDLKELSELGVSLCVAGGINLDNIDAIIEQKPSIIIVGGAITSSDNPAESSRVIKSKIDQKE